MTTNNPKRIRAVAIIINDRKVFSDLVDQNIITAEQLPSVVRSIDKIKTI